MRCGAAMVTSRAFPYRDNRGGATCGQYCLRNKTNCRSKAPFLSRLLFLDASIAFNLGRVVNCNFTRLQQTWLAKAALIFEVSESNERCGGLRCVRRPSQRSR